MVLRLLPLAAAVFLLAACSGGGNSGEPPHRRVPGIEIVNASARDVMIHWFPKVGEDSRGVAVIRRCTDRLVPIPPGSYSVIVGTAGSRPTRLGWRVTADSRCCVRIRHGGRVVAAIAYPPSHPPC